MKLELKIYPYLCATKIFRINDVAADEEDFGAGYDAEIDRAECSGCGYRKFVKKPATKEVLKKYLISEDEYNIIGEKLEAELTFGHCCWCNSNSDIEFLECLNYEI